MSAPGGFGSAFRQGLVVGLAFVLLLAAVVGVLVMTGHRLPGQARSDAERVLLIAALTDESGDLVAQVIADVDASGAPASVRSVDPSGAVTIAGTSYDHLRDAYAFGGGTGLAEAYDRVGDVGETLPFIDFGREALAAALTAHGGAKLDLPTEMNVFDGDRLYTFPAGPVVADVDELRAILNGAAYLPPSQRLEILDQAADELTLLVRELPGGIEAAINAGTVSTDLGSTGAEAFVMRLTQVN